MNRCELEELRVRWTPELTERGNRYLLGQQHDAPFPDLENGFRDLRGLSISAILGYITLADIDFTGALTERFGQFGSCRVSQCRFRFSEISTNFGKEFTACDLTKANLSGATLRGSFKECDFASANLSSSMAKELRFVRCNFSGVNLRKAHLLHSHFEDCVFGENKFGSGSLAFSKFIRSPLDTSCAGNTIMDRVVFQD